MTLEEIAAAQARARWAYRGDRRPAFAAIPGHGQESVWDYPRPPRVERFGARVRVEFAGITIADTMRALRVCETASAPTYYIPPQDVATRYLEPARGETYCEWKGRARYWSVRVGDQVAERAAFAYTEPRPGYEAIRDHFGFYPDKMDACFAGHWRAMPQPGGFYAGWVTPNLVGPIKGAPGTEAW